MSKSYEELSVEELISNLEHIEESELQSDIRANVQAELKRMKRNLSTVLRFVSHSSVLETSDNPELRKAILDVRRECLLINSMISKVLFLQIFRAAPERWAQYASRATAHYGEMAQAACQICLIAAPLRAQALAAVLSTQ
jgi:hypothetical protein